MAHKILTSRLALALAAAVLVAGAACSPNTPTQEYLGVGGNLSLGAVGATSQLVATLYKQGSAPQDVTKATEWATDNPSVATISATGLLTAVGFGVTKVTARYGRQQALGSADTLSTTSQARVAEPVVNSIRLSGKVSLASVGETSQLTITATVSDGTSPDVTGATTWTSSDSSVATVQPGGLLIANGLGVASITATYKGQVTSATVVVTPPGTIATSGRVRLPGNGGGQDLGVPGFQVLDTMSGRTTTTNAQGHYTMAGLISGTRLAFSKDGYEPVDRVVTDSDGTVAVQQVVRITAGDTVTLQTMTFDVSYSLSPNCINCRLIHIAIPASGTLHLSLSWNDPKVTENLWINGQLFRGTAPGPVTANVQVDPGELVIYAGRTSPVGGQVTLTLTTTLASPDLVASPSGSQERLLMGPASRW